MKYKTMLAFVFTVALVLAACRLESTEVPTMTTEPTMVATERAATEPSMTETAGTAVASPSAEATPTGAAETPTSGVPVTGEPTINVSQATEFGPILVNDEGLSLYIFMNDTQGGESSSCNDDCAAQWPPLLTQGAPVAGQGVDPTLLDTIQREDGTMQVTYNGWPVYHFHGDATLGDTNGQGLDNLWFLVTPTGEPVQQP